MTTITKKEMIDRVAADSPERRAQVQRIIQDFLDEIVKELGKGNRLEFRDFGVFECRHRKPRKAQNPLTLQPVSVPAKRWVKFKAGRLMKQKLSRGLGGGSREESRAGAAQLAKSASSNENASSRKK